MPAVLAHAPASWRDELRATLRLALPLVGTNLLQMAIYAVDVIFIARLGPEPLAASSLSVSLSGLLMWAMSGLVGAASAIMAAELGRHRHAVREVRRTFRMGVWLSVLSGLVGMGVCMTGETIMLATGQNPRVAAMAGDFLLVLMWTMIPLVLSSHLRNTVSALGRPAVSTAIAGFAVAVNALGNYALVFGNFGLPALGLQGSAIASVITSFAMLGAYVIVIQSNRRLRRFALWGRWWRTETQRLRQMLRIGLPIAGTILAEAGLFSGAAFLMGRIGEAELAGHTIALQLAALAFQVPFGIAQATTIRVGMAYGAGDRLWITRAGNIGIVLGIGFMAFTAVLMWGFPRTVLRLYVDPAAPENALMVGFAVQYLVVAAAFQLFDGAQAVAAGALRGLQDTRIPMMIAIFSYWVPGFGLAVWLGLYTPLRGTGVWIGLAVGLVFAAALLLWRWLWRGRLRLIPA
ncbi:MATE family efflux transporter [Sphingomonas sp. GCM10030256]|uniref:MATE family efflux transporter n=1 Tax=Sphingomonas sp. GCM10030256 TaxID=3273427 RepID=UPI003605DADA